jgi:hypothetical protein
MTSAYINNDHTLTVSGLATASGVVLENAEIDYQIYDSDGVAVPGTSGTLLQVGTSNEYTSEIDKEVINLLTLGEEYTVRVTGSDTGYDFEFDIPIRFVRRVT